MPTYVYRCSACDAEFEAQQRIVEPPLTSCPEGHEGTVKRVIQPVGISFKGSGFYVNDSVKAPAPKEEKAKTDAPTTEGAASEGTGESKPAAEAKTTEAKATDPKPSDPKPSDPKPSESKPAGSKPATKTASE